MGTVPHGDGGEGMSSFSCCDKVAKPKNLDLGEGMASSVILCVS